MCKLPSPNRLNTHPSHFLVRWKLQSLFKNKYKFVLYALNNDQCLSFGLNTTHITKIKISIYFVTFSNKVCFGVPLDTFPIALCHPAAPPPDSFPFS